MIKHLAIVMDGNRRWAKEKGLEPVLGYKYGAQAAQKVVNFCLENSISYLSLYTFSLENFKRPKYEQDFVFNLLVEEMEKNLDTYIQKGVKVKFVGDSLLFPKHLVKVRKNIEEKTKHLDKLQVNLLFCYGSRQEIVSGVKKIIAKIKNGELSEDQITEEIFSEQLWTNGIPEPDVVVRAGGQQRLSNFLLYQSAYSEYFFLDCMWPEINSNHFQEILNKFNNRQRNFGI